VAVSILIGVAALLGLGWFTTSLVASLAEPVSLILAAAAGIAFLAEVLRQGYISDYFSTSEGEFLGAGIGGAAVFYTVFVVSQVLIVSLSPLAGLIVVGLGVGTFIFGPGVIFDLFDVLSGGD